jgi:hypothetical protein
MGGRKAGHRPGCEESKPKESAMFKFPLVTIYAIVAFNFTVFTLLLQFDYLMFQSPVAKAAAWVVTLTAWGVAYLNRYKFYTINLTGGNNVRPE